jgi:signal transduction histidine kinase
VARIVSIIKQLSLLVVRTYPPFTKGSLQTLLEGSVRRFQSDNKLTAPVTIENPLGALMIDTNYEMFEEVVSKVLMNAWEAYDVAPDAPHPITIRTKLVEKPGKDQFLQILIDDEGHGVDPEIRDRVFEPFVSTKHTVGVGMGLTIARHALRNLDGEVMLNEREGGGTSVTLLHPLEQKPRKRSDA